MADLPQPTRDTACFSDRQWFVNNCAFSTEADANEAIRLARQYALECVEDLRRQIVDFVQFGATR